MKQLDKDTMEMLGRVSWRYGYKNANALVAVLESRQLVRAVLGTRRGVVESISIQKPWIFVSLAEDTFHTVTVFRSRYNTASIDTLGAVLGKHVRMRRVVKYSNAGDRLISIVEIAYIPSDAEIERVPVED